ncbi:MAG: hypothetical protein QHC90_15200 [Shinella sp.]|jgi:pimeloyl-ACP methyl ester carboxylesterase|nr:hypothetical protein [Shinella sp.]
MAQTEDLKAITVPTLVLHGEDDQVIRGAARGPHQSFGVIGLGDHS